MYFCLSMAAVLGHGGCHCRFNATIRAKYAYALMAKSFVGGKNAVSIV